MLLLYYEIFLAGKVTMTIDIYNDTELGADIVKYAEFEVNYTKKPVILGDLGAKAEIEVSLSTNVMLDHDHSYFFCTSGQWRSLPHCIFQS